MGKTDFPVRIAAGTHLQKDARGQLKINFIGVKHLTEAVMNDMMGKIDSAAGKARKGDMP